MAKRDAEIEPIDDDLAQPDLPPVGERLRAAREKQKLSLEDLAAQTRIPQRHLASLETGDWDSLPAPTYSIGFAKSYASAVGLDRTEIGNQLREEMGGQRFATANTDVFEAADPARTMPKGLVIGAILAVILLIILMSWLNRRSLDEGVPPTAATTARPAAVSAEQAPAPAAAPAAQGPVVLTATDAVWLSIKDGGQVLKQGIMRAGETYQVPTTAMAPVLTTARAEALRINVGTAVAPAIGPAATKINVSLLPADLLKAPGSASTPSTSAPANQPPRTPRPRAAAPAAPAQPPAADAAPTSNVGE